MSGLQLTEFVKRPDVGNTGRATRVRANFFEVQSFPQNNIHHYDVTITPDVPPVINRKIWKTFEDQDGQGSLKGIKPVYDGRKNIFSPKALPLEDNAGMFEITLPEDDARASSSKRPPRIFKLKIKKTGEVVMEELRRFLSGQGACTSGCLTAIMVLDVLIRHLPSMTYATVGRSFFTPQDAKPLANGAEVWQGFYQSARPAVGRMMVNVDVSATAFYESGPLPQMVVKILNWRTVDELRRGISDRDRVKLEKVLRSLKIKVVHRGENNRRYKISKLTSTPADQTFFKVGDSEEKQDVASYFNKTYGKKLSFPFLPCVVVQNSTFLPMEVCEVVPGQRHMKKLNEKQTAEMIKFTCQKPNMRANKISQGLNLLNYKDNDYMQQFGMSVKQDMAVVNARILPTPTVSYNPSTRDGAFVPQGGAWNLRGKRVAQGATLGSWSVVCFTNERIVPMQDIQRFVREMCTTFMDTGMNVVNKTPPITHADPQGNIDRTLKEAWLKAGNAAKAAPQLIVCILPNTGVPLYAEIKRISDTVIGVATQCVQSKHIHDAKKQYCANVCLKVNLKLGGMNSFIVPQQIPFISSRPTILFGADVTHPAPGDMNRPSIAALCASMDARASRYASSIRVQANRTEIIADLANMVKELLKTFYQSSGQKPERILFYRDGVSEGQFKQVYDNEIAAVRAACTSLDADYKPTITFVVVQKRHHARFFPIDQNDTDRTGNCLPGTVVDTNIVHPFEFDFYLQSHAGLQGTSRPTHYHVLYDDNKFTADQLQDLTYRLCYLYGRATRAVSIVPPAYYADLLATRARFHSRGEHWSDTDATSESMDGEGHMASFGVVKPELQKVMFFM
ncbi:hypothetical protein K450DRAFT_215715 [Umbelopsis ramanniana AG]|uniref:Piwi-domain-containing protein n=1 Tax=Umbelopsis ramanniana AG TaxID=1314678 RepID=A0AAD5E285_UMBRA|nr:uncharacterized protein K450DRAFT_215715 [Umbelopsis ramanniana AG]KAI8575439.1 hypothetical protein K450DRAFT_215715 [Umbelopsis ramanniana AG]